MNWTDVAKILGPTILALVVLAFTPIIDQLNVRSWQRRKADLKALVEDCFTPMIAENRVTKQKTESNTAALEFIRVAVMRQGEEMPKLSSAVREMTIAVNTLTDAVDSVKEIAQLARESNIRLEEQVKAWERVRHEDRQAYRGEPRRKSDHI